MGNKVLGHDEIDVDVDLGKYGDQFGDLRSETRSATPEKGKSGYISAPKTGKLGVFFL